VVPHNSRKLARACQVLATAPRWLTILLTAVAFAGCGAGLGDACGETSAHVTTDCDDGLYCAYDGHGGGTGVCVERAKENEPCLGPSSAPPCASGLVCSAVQSPPTCAQPAGQGGLCVENPDCLAGLVCTSPLGVVGNCAAPRKTGEDCFRNDQCAADLKCLPDAASGVAARCGLPAGDGGSCDDLDDCASQNCDFANRICVPIARR